jgi:thiol-disulfide isomerase/thioredoxin
MKASRGRGAALVAAVLLLAGATALSPPARPYARWIVYKLGILQPARPIAAGQPLGTLRVTALDGSELALRPQRGRRLLINVFTTWCPPCQAETPLLASASSQLRRDGIDVVGIDQAESPQSVERFVQAYGLQYPTYIDSNRTSATSLDARIIPTTLLVDARGVVRVIHVGPLDRSDLVAMTTERR